MCELIRSKACNRSIFFYCINFHSLNEKKMYTFLSGDMPNEKLQINLGICTFGADFSIIITMIVFAIGKFNSPSFTI